MSWLKPQRPDMLNPNGQSNSSLVNLSGGSSRPTSPFYATTRRKLRIVGSGTLFVAHTINLAGGSLQQDVLTPNNNLRAQSVGRARGGSVATILSLLCQFNHLSSLQNSANATLRIRPGDSTVASSGLRPLAGAVQPVVEAWLVAPVGRGSEASSILTDLEREGVVTKLCAKREGEGVPSAYVIKSVKEVPREESRQGDTATPADGGGKGNTAGAVKTSGQTRLKTFRTTINYNPIPDLTHEEFIRCLSPLLYPASSPSPSSPRSAADEWSQGPPPDPVFDWLHFEGRTAQTTLSNISGLDGFARERSWRGKMVFSLDCTRPGRPGQDALIPHADVIFFSKAYARSLAYTTPRAFLLSQALRCAPHALLIVSWADKGSALLSIPTKEYFQSSKFVVEPDDNGEYESVFSGTQHGHSLSLTGDASGSGSGGRIWSSDEMGRRTGKANAKDGGIGAALFDDDDEDDDDVIDESGADDAFVAGMIYALSRRVLPRSLYSPANLASAAPGASNPAVTDQDDLERGRWRLEECLRFATEMAGRKVRIKGFAGLARAMENVGWFDD